MKDAPLLNLALAMFLTLSIGWLLFIGRPILLPVVTGLFAVYVMISTSNALHRQLLLRHLPLPFLRFCVLSVFAAAVITLAIVAAATIREIAAVAPIYEANMDAFLESIAARFELDHQELWLGIRTVTIDAFDLRVVFLSLLGGFTNVGLTVFLIVIYAAFLMSERSNFEKKLAAVFSTPNQAQMAKRVIREINTKISDYLAVKTLINVVLGVISFLILWAHGTDFALFWAVMIGLLNYIPYVGSYIGVLFPVILSFAQFASLSHTLSLTFFLTATQFIMGNVIEPRFIGRQVNLSPVIVLIALSVWTGLWGIPGAILAVPLTSVIAIIFASFASTRFIAVLLADRVEE
ncbi:MULTISPECIES: AI-2E family transporter [Falsihalocynthiibacter]|uniref:AI-2E family transporter n=1 Tax=Falsihalocynthiibacter TaxID=2854182 RepID=UPI003001E6FC